MSGQTQNLKSQEIIANRTKDMDLSFRVRPSQLLTL